MVLVVKATIVSSLMIAIRSLQWCASITSLAVVHMALDAVMITYVVVRRHQRQSRQHPPVTVGPIVHRRQHVGLSTYTPRSAAMSAVQ